MLQNAKGLFLLNFKATFSQPIPSLETTASIFFCSSKATPLDLCIRFEVASFSCVCEPRSSWISTSSSTLTSLEWGSLDCSLLGVPNSSPTALSSSILTEQSEQGLFVSYQRCHLYLVHRYYLEGPFLGLVPMVLHKNAFLGDAHSIHKEDLLVSHISYSSLWQLKHCPLLTPLLSLPIFPTEQSG